MRISDNFIQALVRRANIVDVISQYMTLKKSGANYVGLCPFHNEKTPSFSVSESKQFYHCFGCGANGSVIGFVMAHQGLPFVDAVRQLADHYGMPVPQSSPAEERQAQARSSLVEVMDNVATFYRLHLPHSPALNYINQRGISAEMAEAFALGYAPDNSGHLLAHFGSTAQDNLVAGGLLKQKEEDLYPYFRGRLMFPIRNVRGQVLGFGGRIIGSGEPKYLNSPDTVLFNKGEELYGVFESRQTIREKAYVLVVEGYIDVIALAQQGLPAVATLGTACTATQVQKLMRLSDTVVFAFDGDTAGSKAARRALLESLPLIVENKTLKFLFLPPEHDPDSFVREQGKEAFEATLQQALPLSTFFLAALGEGRDRDSVEGRAAMQAQGRKWLALIQATAYRRQLASLVAQTLECSPQELLDAPLQAPAPRDKGSYLRLDQANIARGRALSQQRRTLSLEHRIVLILLMRPDFFGFFSPDIEARCIAHGGGYASLYREIFDCCRHAQENVEGLTAIMLAEILLQKDPRTTSLLQEARALPLPEDDSLYYEFSQGLLKLQIDALVEERAQLAAHPNLGNDEMAAIRVLLQRETELKKQLLHSRHQH